MACSATSTLDDSFELIAQVVLEETARSRERLHIARRPLCCDAAFRLVGEFHVSGDCPCVEEYIDVLRLVHRYLSDLDPSTVVSYGAMARAHCQLRAVADVQRQRRGRHTQQRVDRLADSLIGRALATDQQRALLVDVVTEAGSAAPMGDEAFLHRCLAERRARRFGGTAAEHLPGIAEDLPIVRAAADKHGVRRRGSDGNLVSWWEHYVERGLGERVRLGVIPIDTAAAEGQPSVDVEDLSAAAALDRVLDEIVAGAGDVGVGR